MRFYLVVKIEWVILCKCLEKLFQQGKYKRWETLVKKRNMWNMKFDMASLELSVRIINLNLIGVVWFKE